MTEAEQAQLVTDSYRLLDGESYVQVAFYYGLRNDWWSHDDPRSMEACFGLLRTDFSPKPAYAAFRSYAMSERTFSAVRPDPSDAPAQVQAARPLRPSASAPRVFVSS